jgi:hypothetical protein
MVPRIAATSGYESSTFGRCATGCTRRRRSADNSQHQTAISPDLLLCLIKGQALETLPSA